MYVLHMVYLKVSLINSLVTARLYSIVFSILFGDSSYETYI
jgi:hypothetical protein